MRSSTISTFITVFLHPDEEEHALYLIGEEIFTVGGIAHELTRKLEEHVTLDNPPFTISHREKQLVFVLKSPPTTKQLEDLAQLAITGFIYGFTIKGEIDLEGKIVNNLPGDVALRMFDNC